MITSIPTITTVADLQRNYRFLVNKIKLTGEPMVVVSNGKPDVVVIDAGVYHQQMKLLKEAEENRLLKLAKAALGEHNLGKTTKLSEGQTLEELLAESE